MNQEIFSFKQTIYLYFLVQKSVTIFNYSIVKGGCESKGLFYYGLVNVEKQTKYNFKILKKRRLRFGLDVLAPCLSISQFISKSSSSSPNGLIRASATFRISGKCFAAKILNLLLFLHKMLISIHARPRALSSSAISY